jgi:hypothetical protein
MPICSGTAANRAGRIIDENFSFYNNPLRAGLKQALYFPEYLDSAYTLGLLLR